MESAGYIYKFFSLYETFHVLRFIKRAGGPVNLGDNQGEAMKGGKMSSYFK